VHSSSTALFERFGERLIIAKGDESTYAVAKRTGISESLIRKYLSGASVPLINRAADLAAALKVDLTWLATGEGLMRPTNIDAQTPYAGKDARVPALIFENKQVTAQRR
jgi:transcriptional regulator with XRE-family HTH domain